MKYLLNAKLLQGKNQIILEKKLLFICEKECCFAIRTVRDKVDLCSQINDGGSFKSPDECCKEDHDCVADTTLSSAQRPQALVLFVKAEAGNVLLKQIMETKKLLPRYSEELYLHVMNLWVGDPCIVDERFISDFNKFADPGKIAKLDFVMLLINLPKEYKGADKTANSLERMKFISQICEEELAVKKISNRLNFNTSSSVSLAWEK